MEDKQLRKLSASDFKRLVGVQRQTFQTMVRLVKREYKKLKKQKKIRSSSKIRGQKTELINITIFTRVSNISTSSYQL